MNYQGGYPSSDGCIDVEYTEVILVPHGPGSHLLPRCPATVMGEVMEQAMVLVTHNHCQALLAKSGLEHTAAPSMMEQQLASMTPQGAERYREIVDAYAQKAAN